MSEKPAEYLKRTCLICGCHTNLTINIYEPRNGPNIVELIQAKFKFQPLNDDKYLCFSCNNWLINWHSLQAVNSNEAESESPSGTFRSHMNSMPQEKGGASQRYQPFVAVVCRPIAQVRPRQLAEAETPSAHIPKMQEQLNSIPAAITKLSSKVQNYSKRSFCLNHRLRRRIQRRSMRSCCMCKRSFVVRMRANMNTAAEALKSKSSKCRKCREVCPWRTLTMRSMKVRNAAHFERVLLHKTLEINNDITRSNLVNTHTNIVKSQNNAQENNQSQVQRRHLQRPLVDGKVVSMLRRLGTTLSYESQHNGSSVNTSSTSHRLRTASPLKQLLQIMSPVKQKPRWTRQLEDDEILLDFDTAISEVLPTIVNEEDTAKQVKRKLTYQMSVDVNEVIDISDTEEQAEQEQIFNLLPKGLRIFLV